MSFCYVQSRSSIPRTSGFDHMKRGFGSAPQPCPRDPTRMLTACLVNATPCNSPSSKLKWQPTNRTTLIVRVADRPVAVARSSNFDNCIRCRLRCWPRLPQATPACPFLPNSGIKSNHASRAEYQILHQRPCLLPSVNWNITTMAVVDTTKKWGSRANRAAGRPQTNWA